MGIKEFVHLFRWVYIPVTETTLYRLFLFKAYWPDEKYLKWKFKKRIGHSLNLTDPKTYNEKLQWLKLYDRNDKYTQYVDKYLVREYVKKTIGEEYLVPLLGVWKGVNEICFDELPNQFVLKTNHDSGGVIICKDKSSLDRRGVCRFLKKRMKANSYWPSREWPYKNVHKRIIAEKYLTDGDDNGLSDYKFFCFDGICKAAYIATDRFTDTRFDFFSPAFEHLPIVNGYRNAAGCIKKPKTWDKMVLLAEKLARGIPQVRIDLYDVNGQIYFGEMTMFHWGGLMPFEPEKWDYVFGSWITLPVKQDR